MDESYKAPQSAHEEETPAPDETDESVDEESAGAAEILVEKVKLPAGTKEGDTVTFKVKKDFGDEVSLEAATPSAPEETEEPETAEEGELKALAGEEM